MMAVRRVRRPKNKEALLVQLTDPKSRGPFEAYRDVLGFAAALGFARGRRVPFDQSSEPIAWETFANRSGNEALVNMIAAVGTEDFNILSPERFDERLTVFEEYANGGLEVLQEALARSHRSAVDVILDLLADAEGGVRHDQPIELDAIAEELAL